MTQTPLRFCIIIPVYCHADPLVQVLRRLESVALPCFVVDDGNESPLKEALEFGRWPWVTALRLETHGGKSAACTEGARRASGMGFSHAIFVDADNQHAVEDIPRILELAIQHPDAMILGRPLFDGSAPFTRRFGRTLSNFWVWIETLSLEIEDSLCGFRCFPLTPFLKAASGAPFSGRMDFDPDIVVRLYWQGLPVINFDTHVLYPANGISNFNLWRDNVALFRLHTRHFFGMLLRIPSLLNRHRTHAV